MVFAQADSDQPEHNDEGIDSTVHIKQKSRHITGHPCRQKIIDTDRNAQLFHENHSNQQLSIQEERIEDLINKLINASKEITALNTWMECLEEAMGNKKERILKKAFKIKEGLRK